MEVQGTAWGHGQGKLHHAALRENRVVDLACLPNNEMGKVRGTVGSSWHPSHTLHCYCTWHIHRLSLGSASSTGGFDLKCDTRYQNQYQKSWTGQAWQEAMTRKPMCMHKKGKPPWKFRPQILAMQSFSHLKNHCNSQKYGRRRKISAHY